MNYALTPDQVVALGVKTCSIDFRRILLIDGRPVFYIIGGGHERRFTESELGELAAWVVRVWNGFRTLQVPPVARQFIQPDAADVRRLLLADGRPVVTVAGGGHEQPFTHAQTLAISEHLVQRWNAAVHAVGQL